MKQQVKLPRQKSNWKKIVILQIVIFVVVFYLFLNVSFTQNEEDTCDPLTDLKFLLYTQMNLNNPQSLQLMDSKSVFTSNFNESLTTVYLIHGWNADRNGQLNLDIRHALNSMNQTLNIIVVEWKNCAQSSNYDVVRYRLESVGAVVARFIDFIIDLYPTHLDNTELVGHSFGAHVAGFVAKKLQNSRRVKSLIGLDPAGKLFYVNDTTSRLDRGDAEYVEIIHTDTRGIGFPEPIGHVDHYPNYGHDQPGCDGNSCNHRRAIEYFALSILKHLTAQQCFGYENIVADLCNRTGLIGNVGGVPLTRTNALGVYYFKTTED